MESQRLLKPIEVADRLNLTDGTVTAWIREGRLKGVRVGRRAWRVRPEDLEAFLRQGEQVAA